MTFHLSTSSSLRRALKDKGREFILRPTVVRPPSFSDPSSSRRSFSSSPSPPTTPPTGPSTLLSNTQPTLASLQNPSPQPSSLPSAEPSSLPLEHADFLPKIDLSALPLYEESNKLAYWFLEHPIPVPEWFPLGPYTTTIILGTVALRLALTLPIQIWARKREERLREIAVPKIKAFKAKSSSEYAIKQETKRIIKLLRCSPRPMVIVPLLTQLPLFLTMSITLRAASELPTPLLAEHLPSLLSQVNLASPDPWLSLPLAVGALAYYNTRYVRQARRERDELDPYMDAPKLKEEFEEYNRKGERIVDWRDTKEGWKAGKLDQFFLLGGFTMYGVSIISPAAMQVYFITTYTFNLVQAYFFRSSDRTRLLSLRSQLRSKGLEPPLEGDARALSPQSPEPLKVAPVWCDNYSALSEEVKREVAKDGERKKKEEGRRKMEAGLAAMKEARRPVGSVGR